MPFEDLAAFLAHAPFALPVDGVCVAGCSVGKRIQKDRPNFLVILCDDLGYGDLACYGHPHIKTPHLDKLATQGMRLTSCYAAAPVCSPSRAGMLTGRTPNRSGVYNWIPGNHVMHLRKDEVTVAAMLKNSGYDTAHVGKWHCNGKFNSPAQPQPGDHGFNHWFATQTTRRRRTRIRVTLCATANRWGQWKATPASWWSMKAWTGCATGAISRSRFFSSPVFMSRTSRWRRPTR